MELAGINSALHKEWKQEGNKPLKLINWNITFYIEYTTAIITWQDDSKQNVEK